MAESELLTVGDLRHSSLADDTLISVAGPSGPFHCNKNVSFGGGNVVLTISESRAVVTA